MVSAERYSPACFKICLTICGAMSPGWLGIVTLPGFEGCVYWQCEPFEFLYCHPSAKMIFSISRNRMLLPPFDYIMRIMRVKVKKNIGKKDL